MKQQEQSFTNPLTPKTNISILPTATTTKQTNRVALLNLNRKTTTRQYLNNSQNLKNDLNANNKTLKGIMQESTACVTLELLTCESQVTRSLHFIVACVDFVC